MLNQTASHPWALVLLVAMCLLLIVVVILQAIGLSKTQAAANQHTHDAQMLRSEMAEQGSANRSEIGQNIGQMAGTLQGQVVQVREAVALDNRVNREEVSNALQRFAQSQERQLSELKATNEAKLEEMRRTVDEKLHATLEQRLGDSFKQVSDRLEQVHRGLGEMQSLAIGVGDLKRVLGNVKTRGIWGEVQLATLLEQLMTPDQYETNVATRPNSNERVEFAIRMPGRGEDRAIRLPIDAKFPREDYERLLDAQDRADAPAAELAAKQLELRIRAEAKAIRDKYIEPPYTTDFALLFLPTEGLFAEVLRRPGLTDDLQRLYRVTIAGPTTLSALLNSLQMGFKTLAIEQRSSEVRVLLGAVKTEFGKFGEVLAKTKAQLQTVSNTIDSAQVRSRAIERKLRGVDALGEVETKALLPGLEADTETDLPDDSHRSG